MHHIWEKNWKHGSHFQVLQQKVKTQTKFVFWFQVVLYPLTVIKNEKKEKKNRLKIIIEICGTEKFSNNTCTNWAMNFKVNEERKKNIVHCYDKG